MTNSAANEGRRDYRAAAPWRPRTLRAALGHVAALRGGTPPRARAAPQLKAVLARSFGVLSAAFSRGCGGTGAAPRPRPAQARAAWRAARPRHRRRLPRRVRGRPDARRGAARLADRGADRAADGLRVPAGRAAQGGAAARLLAHSLPAPRNPLADGAQAAALPGSCASGTRLGRAALPANVSLALALQAAAAAAAATEPEDEWQPMLSIPLEAAVDDEPYRARTHREE